MNFLKRCLRNPKIKQFLSNSGEYAAANRTKSDSAAISACGSSIPTMDSVNSNGLSSYRWTPGSIIDERYTVGKGHACLVLNRAIQIPDEIAQRLWQNAHLRCLVDGGANRWRQFLTRHCQYTTLLPPDLITGDFDSITPETTKFFSDPLTRHIHTPDQNATDFTKAIDFLRPLLLKKQINDIVVFHDNSGRFDQIMANINTLHKMQTTELNIHLLSGNAITWLLRPGKHSIQIPSELVAAERWCALMPIGAPACDVTTTGLKWDLTNAPMYFGGMVSTSNTYSSEEIQITTDTALIWSMGLFAFSDD